MRATPCRPETIALEQLLERADLLKFIKRTISIGEVKRWKPRREAYHHCAAVVGLRPERLALVRFAPGMSMALAEPALWQAMSPEMERDLLQLWNRHT